MLFKKHNNPALKLSTWKKAIKITFLFVINEDAMHLIVHTYW